MDGLMPEWKTCRYLGQEPAKQRSDESRAQEVPYILIDTVANLFSVGLRQWLRCNMLR